VPPVNEPSVIEPLGEVQKLSVLLVFVLETAVILGVARRETEVLLSMPFPSLTLIEILVFGAMPETV
jgi:hypothetical protein